MSDREWLAKKEFEEFKKNHPDLQVNNIYTGPSELNSKKKNTDAAIIAIVPIKNVNAT